MLTKVNSCYTRHLWDVVLFTQQRGSVIRGVISSQTSINGDLNFFRNSEVSAGRELTVLGHCASHHLLSSLDGTVAFSVIEMMINNNYYFMLKV